MLGIASNYTSPYYPQTNGQVERYNRTLVRQLRCYISKHQKEWGSHLSLLTAAYNTQVHASTGEITFSPLRAEVVGVGRGTNLPVGRTSKQAELPWYHTLTRPEQTFMPWLRGKTGHHEQRLPAGKTSNQVQRDRHSASFPLFLLARVAGSVSCTKQDSAVGRGGIAC